MYSIKYYTTILCWWRACTVLRAIRSLTRKRFSFRTGSSQSLLQTTPILLYVSDSLFPLTTPSSTEVSESCKIYTFYLIRQTFFSSYIENLFLSLARSLAFVLSSIDISLYPIFILTGRMRWQPTWRRLLPLLRWLQSCWLCSRIRRTASDWK